MKYLYLLLVMASVAADAMEPGSQYKPLAEAGDPRAQYYGRHLRQLRRFSAG